MRLDLESMVISAFRNFDVDQRVVYPQSGVTAIVGKDTDEGGSNGTGKSTFSTAPLVNLFGYKYGGSSIKNLENRYLDESAQLVGNYRVDGKLLTVDRTLGGKLSFVYDGTPNKDGKTEAIQEELNGILKIAPEQLSVLSSKPQGEFGGFLLMNDSKKKEFLSSFFDVTDIEHAKALADAELTTQNKELATLNGKLEFATSYWHRKVQELETARKAFLSVDTDDYRKTVSALKTQIVALESNKIAMESVLGQPDHEFRNYAMSFDEVMKIQNGLLDRLDYLGSQRRQQEEKILELQDRIAELDRNISSIPPLPAELQQHLSQIDAVIKEQERRQKKARELHSTMVATDTQLKIAQNELARANESTCSSCGSPLSAEKIQAKRAKVEAAIPYFQNQVDALSAQINEHEVSADDIAKAREFREAILNNISTWKATNNPESFYRDRQNAQSFLYAAQGAVKSFTDSIRNESQQVDLAVARIRTGVEQALSKLKLDIANVNTSITAKEEVFNRARREVIRIEYETERAIKDAAAIEAQSLKLKEDIAVNTHVSKITSKAGFIGYIFDSLLEDLNSTVNENLKMIPNARKFSLQFSSDKLVATTGAVNKAITYEMFSGKESIAFDTLSGGEKLSTILAVDEALDEVLSDRLGIKVGWKFLDEQFYWIDENSKEAILNFYRTKSSDRAFFIVDHASEFNASFDNQIVIIKTNNIARIAS